MLDPIRRLLAEAGKAKQTRAFWQTVTDILSEYAGGARVELTYKGLSESGTLDAGAAGTDGETFLTDYHDAEGRHVSARFEGLAAGFPGEVLRSTIEIATHLAVMVARRSGLERERRLGTFLVELSRWLLAAPDLERRRGRGGCGALPAHGSGGVAPVHAHGAAVPHRGGGLYRGRARAVGGGERRARRGGAGTRHGGRQPAPDGPGGPEWPRAAAQPSGVPPARHPVRSAGARGAPRGARPLPQRDLAAPRAGAAARRLAVARPGPRDPGLGGPPHLRLHHHRRVGGRAGQPVGGTVRPDRRAARPARADRPREARHRGRDRQRRGA